MPRTWKRSRTLIGLLFFGSTTESFQSSFLTSHNNGLCYVRPSGNVAVRTRHRQVRQSHDDVSENAAGETAETFSRRDALRGIAGAAFTVAVSPVLPANAGLAEIDGKTGNLFSPKNEMLSGGSLAARGIPETKSASGLPRGRGKPGEALQSIYETRFVAYLSRFLLNFDPSARAFWVQQGFGYSWENGPDESRDLKAEAAFAEFAESVEVGLADYFSGPFGSYSSLPAMMAGINAAQPAPSRKSEIQSKHGFLDDIFRLGRKKENSERKVDNSASAKQGILNLYTLLKARYNSLSAKRQLAILFSFVSLPSLQPTSEICSLLGEADNATVTEIRLTFSNTRKSETELESRTSSRRGGGYSLADVPTVKIDSPSPLGDRYQQATAIPLLDPTSRVLRINITDGGTGYTTVPSVIIVQNNGLVQRQCQATAIMDRAGSVESVVVLDSGYGYGGGRKNMAPKVVIDGPSIKGGRRAKATAELEYQISGIKILKGGNGYVSTEPPNVHISEPREDPSWFVQVQEEPSLRMVPVVQTSALSAEVTEMKSQNGAISYSSNEPEYQSDVINDDLFERLQRDPLELLPSAARPALVRDSGSSKSIYCITQLATVPQFVAVMSPRYRACDPIFGGVGRLPVTKGAAALTASEYGRLALSGAVCTVIVRTLLNPLELVKTKQQLQNDDELFDFARSILDPVENVPSDKKTSPRKSSKTTRRSSEATTASKPNQQADKASKATKTPVGTNDLIKAIIDLRGPFALFQSSDITFLASLVFGSFGFGATELFRRSFTESFSSGGEGGSELVLLLAAGVATVLTAAFASPFEVLRVRSMSLVESKKWTSVLEDFLEDKASSSESRKQVDKDSNFDLRTLKPQDILPLWSGFAPILSRELPFAVTKFLVFDLIAKATLSFLNAQASDGSIPIQVGVGPIGLTVSAGAGALAGVAAAVISHPADLILTKTSTSKRTTTQSNSKSDTSSEDSGPAWIQVVKDLIGQDGGLANLFVGLGSRSIFFFLVIGLQFFLYDYVKNLFQVGSDDLSLVLDVFYAVRAGLVGMDSTS